ncbi:LysE family transporter [Neisseria leonii]|uniref:LysE family transporter n=1 Tax=Neisseria leonii TaxID=2995413 RepID=A0A9X4E7Q7_9NEIS|nr:LysE family transporter [Neisseria sp. 51.81]MDD9327113.1 LysE family transporter [Neisseria sp. 51.81]
MQAFFSGLMITGGLITAIGAQNAFVLKQGLLKQHVGLIVLVCWLCDVLLIGAGVYGMSTLISDNLYAQTALAAAGGLFLLAYGCKSARSAWLGNHVLQLEAVSHTPPPAGKIVLATLALTLLNPHAYIDAMILIGGSAAGLPQAGKLHFLAGSLLASGIWFIAIGFGSRLMLPLFQRARTWRILDSLIAAMMLYLSYTLFRQIAQTWWV